MQGSDDPEESWNLLGSTSKSFSRGSSQAEGPISVAIRRGYGMGLHRLLAPSRATLIEREIRKRTWCACFTLDRYTFLVSFPSLSTELVASSLMTVTLDRPTAITTSTAAYPLPIALPDEALELVDFFNASTCAFCRNSSRLLADPEPQKSLPPAVGRPGRPLHLLSRDAHFGIASIRVVHNQLPRSALRALGRFRARPAPVLDLDRLPRGDDQIGRAHV